MYNTRPGLLIGFHGCDAAEQQALLSNKNLIPVSDKPYDWLGHGMYFWENNYDRAMEWAKDKQAKGKIKEPAVIGAVIDLGHCCDMLDTQFINMVSRFNRLLKINNDAVGKPMPVNKDVSIDPHNDKLMRFLDCATLEFMHEKIREGVKTELAATGGFTNYKVFDSARGAYMEGGEAYEGAGFNAKSHIQICIRNSNCIKGFFLKREEIDFIQSEVDRVN